MFVTKSDLGLFNGKIMSYLIKRLDEPMEDIEKRLSAIEERLDAVEDKQLDDKHKRSLERKLKCYVDTWGIGWSENKKATALKDLIKIIEQQDILKRAEHEWERMLLSEEDMKKSYAEFLQRNAGHTYGHKDENDGVE